MTSGKASKVDESRMHPEIVTAVDSKKLKLG